jgi:CrcB protein
VAQVAPQPPLDRRALLPPPRAVALVALGGAVGTVARYGLGQRFPGAGAFPVATFGENVVGAALLGLLLAVLVSGRPPSGWVRPLLATGALGAFTTFSTFATELALLGREGRTSLAVAYAAATLAAGAAAAGAGMRLGRRLCERGPRAPAARTGPTPDEAATP